mmetsp:Transcript_11712/g.29776  ORF Transcript_11712/g.29776 Transcript_11712/m.29776 type:complete len:345 (-) Transcript_11712:230-1264(-)
MGGGGHHSTCVGVPVRKPGLACKNARGPATPLWLHSGIIVVIIITKVKLGLDARRKVVVIIIQVVIRRPATRAAHEVIIQVASLTAQGQPRGSQQLIVVEHVKVVVHFVVQVKPVIVAPAAAHDRRVVHVVKVGLFAGPARGRDIVAKAHAAASCRCRADAVITRRGCRARRRAVVHLVRLLDERDAVKVVAPEPTLVNALWHEPEPLLLHARVGLEHGQRDAGLPIKVKRKVDGLGRRHQEGLLVARQLEHAAPDRIGELPARRLLPWQTHVLARLGVAQVLHLLHKLAPPRVGGGGGGGGRLRGALHVVRQPLGQRPRALLQPLGQRGGLLGQLVGPLREQR